VPFIAASYPDEGWEVKARVVAHVLIVRLHRRVHEEVSNALINIRGILKGGDERSDVLEGRASHNLA